MVELLQTALLLAVLGVLGWQHIPMMGKVSSRKRRMLLDSCAVIDGRILELSRSGFVPEELIVPEFILHELQMLADGADAHKRERARYGLDVVQELQTISQVHVTIDRSDFGKMPTDDKLIELASKLNAPLYTTDFNLNKLAEIKGVRVLNVNELAQNLRPTALPGEKRTVKILQKGSNPKQGVGYLDDGTMIVVDNGAKLIGRTAEVEVTRVHQTVAGKMLFAEVTHAAAAQAATPTTGTKRSMSGSGRASGALSPKAAPAAKRPLVQRFRRNNGNAAGPRRTI